MLNYALSILLIATTAFIIYFQQEAPAPTPLVVDIPQEYAEQFKAIQSDSLLLATIESRYTSIVAALADTSFTQMFLYADHP